MQWGSASRRSSASSPRGRSGDCAKLVIGICPLSRLTIVAIEVDEDSAPYAVAGQNVTLYLSGIDAIHLAIGTVLCPTSKPVPLVSHFTAQILVFDVSSPIITGTPVCSISSGGRYADLAQVELFHHSMNLPATISKLVSISEKGAVVKRNPRSVHLSSEKAKR